MKIKNILILLASAVLWSFSSCKQHKEMQRAKAEDKTILASKTFSLLDSLKTHSFKYHTINARIKTTFKSNDGDELDLTITMRGVSDSAIWMSISPGLGIEAARVLFTRDSVKVMDKINGKYARESYDFLRLFTQATINFDMLQNILTGNAAFINDTLTTDSISNNYAAHCSQNALLQALVITKLFRVFENNITDTHSLDKIHATYEDFQFVENEWFPFDLKIQAESKGKTATVEMNYSNVSINAPVEIRFNIPASYTKMKY